MADVFFVKYIFLVRETISSSFGRNMFLSGTESWLKEGRKEEEGFLAESKVCKPGLF